MTLALLAALCAQDVSDVENKFGAPAMRVPKPKTPPEIDGNLDDPAWSQAAPVMLRFSVGGWDMPAERTEARVLADETAIYFAVRCFESQPSRVNEDQPGAFGNQATTKAGELRRGFMSGDTVEFFLDPGHREKRFEYQHVIVSAAGKVYVGYGLEERKEPTDVRAKTGTIAGGWTVEAAIPMPAEIPKIWGLNICRQRPELGVVMPQAAKKAGPQRFTPANWKLDEPEKYRVGEYSAWSPTLAEYSGWPFLKDARPFHIPERFGHALLEVGTKDVEPPAKLFEVILKHDFDDGQVGPFENAVIHDDGFRGPGKCLATRPGGKNEIRLVHELRDLDDATLILTFKTPENARFLYFGWDRNKNNFGSDRNEVFMTREEAQARAQLQDRFIRAAALDTPFPPFDRYHTHADMMSWKMYGRLRQAPGSWTLLENFYGEPTCGKVVLPGKDWAILRTRLGVFRKFPGPGGGQLMAPRDQAYLGLAFRDEYNTPFMLDDVVIFRGIDVEPPVRVKKVSVERDGDELKLSWDRAKDNTLTAYYHVYAGPKRVAETHRLSARLKAAEVGDANLTVVAFDLYGNASER